MSSDEINHCDWLIAVTLFHVVQYKTSSANNWYHIGTATRMATVAEQICLLCDWQENPHFCQSFREF
jgi:hypothetical protein